MQQETIVGLTNYHIVAKVVARAQLLLSLEEILQKKLSKTQSTQVVAKK